MSSNVEPGCVLLVVGPSGAGKDSLLRAARVKLAVEPGLLFVQRIITRPFDAHEDHRPVSPEEFERMAQAGAFALSWRAHGHSYGVPASMLEDVRAGTTVICNASRTVIDEARRKFPKVLVIEITAPEAILQARLAERSRESVTDRSRRLRREVTGYMVDLQIENVGTIEQGAALLARSILRCLRRGEDAHAARRELP